jgi:hypothetical protein
MLHPTKQQEQAMARQKKTWGEKMKAAELKTIAPGSTLSIQAFRRGLAVKNDCDATCPVSTSIFLRIVAEHSWEEYSRTGSTRGVAPFWRVLESDSPIAKKLSFDPAWIDLQRELES